MKHTYICENEGRDVFLIILSPFVMINFDYT